MEQTPTRRSGTRGPEDETVTRTCDDLCSSNRKVTDPNEVPRIQPARAPPGDAAADEGTEVPPNAVTTPRGSAGPLAHDLDEKIQLRLSQRHTRCVAPREFKVLFLDLHVHVPRDHERTVPKVPG